MRLKGIKLSGFKSFVDTTSLQFPTQMTCIVGPNGCGKSNTIDAVRWVLGESSAKNLRGDNMTDVIFNGSAKRHPSSQASVELIFEGTEGKQLSHPLANRNELSIKRIVTMDKKSTYYLNHEKCRRKDIIDLFLGTGLGPRSYSIIEQGMISKLIESKPDELRVFLEEAAGISKYKERRRETQNRLKQTRLNLERLDDVRHEMSKTIEKLRRQSTAAARYRELKAFERKLKSHIAVLNLTETLRLKEQFTAELGSVKLELEKHNAQNTNTETQLIRLKESRDILTDEVDENQREASNTSNEIVKLEEMIKQIKSTQLRLRTEIQRDEETIRNEVASKAIEENEINDLSESINFDEPELEMRQAHAEELQAEVLILQEESQSIFDEWESTRDQISQTQNKAATLNSELNFTEKTSEQQRARKAELESDIELLSAQVSDNGVQTLQENLSHADIKILNIEDSHEKYIQKQNEVTDEIEFTSQKINTLNEQLFSKKSELETLKHIQNESDLLNGELKEWVDHNLPNARALSGELTVEEGWEIAVENTLSLMGNPIYSDSINSNLPSAHISLVSKPNGHKVRGSLSEKVLGDNYPEFFNHIGITNVSLPMTVNVEGVLRSDAWVHTGNSSGSNGFFERGKRIEILVPQIEQLEQQVKELVGALSSLKEHSQQISREIADINKRLNDAYKAQTSIQTELEFKLTEIDRNKEQLRKASEALQKLNFEIVSTGERKATIERTLTEFTLHLSNMQTILTKKQAAKDNASHKIHDAELNATKAKQSLHDIQIKTQTEKAKLQALKQNLHKSSARVAQLNESTEFKRAELEETYFPLEEHEAMLHEKMSNHSNQAERLEHSRQRLSDAITQIRDIELGASSIRDQENKIKDRIQEIQLNIERANVLYEQHDKTLNELDVKLSDYDESHLSASLDDLEEELSATTQSISKLGAVNLTAIEEYETQLKRKEYLDAQNDDLIESIKLFEAAINKIDNDSRSKFKMIFEQVNEGLQDLFPKVFGGGGAYLELTSNDLLEAGVSIMARPPGKKNSTIHLLSGGEKALTALSLVFSIFKLNPAPFCMLDEVDAPLDDVNVGRFCRLVKSMSDDVQFVYISHNKVAMEMAHALSGVTMNEPGVSRLVSVNIDELNKFID